MPLKICPKVTIFASHPYTNNGSNKDGQLVYFILLEILETTCDANITKFTRDKRCWTWVVLVIVQYFSNLGMFPNIIWKGVFLWKNIDGDETKHRYLILATDDMLLTTKSTKASTFLEQLCNRYFTYIKRDSIEISSLNFRII